MDPLAVLSKTVLFEGVSREHVEALAPSVNRRTYTRGAYIFHEGDPGNVLYVILSGQVKISRMSRSGEEAVFAVLAPGEMFGELALFDEQSSRAADAQAVDLTECLTLERVVLLDFLDHHPSMARQLIKQVSRYLRASDDTFSEAAFLDIPGRVARRLLELARTHGEPAPDGTRISLRLPQRTLAGMVGASRERVNRALSRLTARGAISQAGGFITVHRPEELRKQL